MGPAFGGVLPGGVAANGNRGAFEATAKMLGPLALNDALWLTWGTTPQRRLLQFVLFVQMLARVPCGWLDLGSPESTAELIESAMEGPWG